MAVLPAFLNALTGEGVHVVTVNDYLARRDCEWVGQVHRFLGLQVGLIQRRSSTPCLIVDRISKEEGGGVSHVQQHGLYSPWSTEVMASWVGNLLYLQHESEHLLFVYSVND